jgi:acylglycerol lipase
VAAFPSEFTTADGLALPCRALAPTDGAPVRAALVLVHGLGDHSGAVSYDVLISHLAPRGFACYLYDQRGFGRAPGPRAFTPTFGHLRDDLARFVRLVRAHAPDLPCFLIGLSLGGLIVLDQAIAHPDPLAGVVAAAPALGRPQVPRTLLALAPFLSRATPQWRLDPRLDIANLSRDQVAAQAYVDDPLYEPRTSARLGWETVRTMRETMMAAPRMHVPLLLLHGDADRITSPAGSAEFHARAGAADKTLIVYRGAVHNPLIDIERDQVLADVTDWLLRRTAARHSGEHLH